MAAAVALAALSGCSGEDGAPRPAERIVVADGRTLHLASLGRDGLVELDSAELPGEGLLAGHAIFGIMKHPKQPWLYVTSFNDCGASGDWCWGNARIDRFVIGQRGIEHDGVVFEYDETATLAPCAAVDWGYEGQVGACAPVNGAFSADGTRLYVKEDDNDVLDVFVVGADGALTHAWEGEETYLHGIAVHPTEGHVYNGTTVFDVGGDEGVALVYGEGGNDTAFLQAGADALLLTTLDTYGVGIYSLEDPAAPVEIDSHAFTTGTGSTWWNSARAVAATAAVDRLVVAGRNHVATLGFDGSELTVEDELDLSGGESNVENRSVALVDGGRHAVVSWFQASEASPSGWSGGLTVYAIAEDGTITPGATLPLDGMARVVKAFVVR